MWQWRVRSWRGKPGFYSLLPCGLRCLWSHSDSFSYAFSKSYAFAYSLSGFGSSVFWRYWSGLFAFADSNAFCYSDCDAQSKSGL